ncbi:glycerate kinase [Exiguobacterium marinum]|uniref:Glycerate kinase n=1 Tax=Exiguobacterium marinum TaxID=273528 RepID=A0ABY7WY50_9BACL|nr:glycerate kinase [Exiguobacterium marinum]WDH75448.1 glycerate kinase [Exiguobacterium marinum]
MRVICAIDSFKGSLSSREVGEAAANGAIRAGAEAVVFPIADGGEGTLEALMSFLPHELVHVMAEDLMHRPFESSYARFGDFALIECAETLGITKFTPGPEFVPYVSSYGLGQQIKDALPAARIVVTLGGSGTTDGGTGMLQALGAVFTSNGRVIPHDTNPLWTFDDVDLSGLDSRLQSTELVIATDVTNPLDGETGAAHVFAAQKGAMVEQIQRLDRQLDLLGHKLGDIADIQGSGAAGGLGAGLLALGGRIISGFDWVAETIGLREASLGADLIITGEGRIDHQSAKGKVPVGVARLGQELDVPVVALAGSVGMELGDFANQFAGVFSIQSTCRPLDEAMLPHIARAEIERSAEQIVRLRRA